MTMLEPAEVRCSCRQCMKSFKRADKLKGASGLSGFYERQKNLKSLITAIAENPGMAAALTTSIAASGVATGVLPTPAVINSTASDAREAAEFVRENAAAIEQTNQVVADLEPRIAGAEQSIINIDANTGAISGRLTEVSKQVDEGAKQLEVTSGNLGVVDKNLEAAEELIASQGGGLDEAKAAITAARTAVAATQQTLESTKTAVAETQTVLSATKTALTDVGSAVTQQATQTAELATALTQAKETVSEAIKSGDAAKAAASQASASAETAFGAASDAQATAAVAQQAVDAVNETLVVVDQTLAAAQATLGVLDVQIRTAAATQAAALAASQKAVKEVFASTFSLRDYPAALLGVEFDAGLSPWRATASISIPEAGFPYVDLQPDVLWAGAWKPYVMTAGLLENCSYGTAKVRFRVTATISGVGYVKVLAIDPVTKDVLSQAEISSSNTVEIVMDAPGVDALPIVSVVAFADGRTSSVRLIGGSARVTSNMTCPS